MKKRKRKVKQKKKDKKKAKKERKNAKKKKVKETKSAGNIVKRKKRLMFGSYGCRDESDEGEDVFYLNILYLNRMQLY